MKLRNINYDHGDGCGCGGPGCSGVNSFADQFKGGQGDNGSKGVRGPSGQNNLLNGSVTDGTTESDGTDVSLGGNTMADLLSMGFNVETTPTLLAVPDPTDISHNKVFIRLSNAELNFLASLKPKLLPDAGTAGNVLLDDGTAWISSANAREFYNTTSVTSFSIDATITSLKTGTLPSLTFTVGSGLAYKFGQQVYMAQYNGGTLNQANYLTGVVASYSVTSLNVIVTSGKGSGTPTEWLISLGSPVQLPYFDSVTNNGLFIKNENGVLVFADAMDYIGKVDIWFLDPTTPRPGWLFCDGATYTNTESGGKYAALYTKLNWSGSPFIVDGTTFHVPNVTDAALMGIGNIISTVGNIGGSNNVTLDNTVLPVASPWKTKNHQHSSGAGGSYVVYDPSGSESLEGDTSGLRASAAAPGDVIGGDANHALTLVLNDGSSASVYPGAAGGQPLSLVQKSLGIKLIIKAF